MTPSAAARDFVRRRAAALFPSGKLTANALAANVAFGAAVLGAQHVELTNHGAWWFVASDFDWLARPHGNAMAPFERMMPFPEQGPGSHRSEVYVSAFAKRAYFWRNDEARWLVGGDADGSAGLAHEGRLPPWCANVLAFRFS